MLPTLQASITDLANQVSRLAQRIDHLLAIAETRHQNAVASKQRALAPTAAECLAETNEVDSKECPLTPHGEETLSKKTRTISAENLVAASLADLHERLGGFIFIETSPLQRADGRKEEIIPATRS